MNKLIVDVAKIRDNLIKIKDAIGAKICAVAKAQCYGLGVKLCKYISDLVDYFAVATIPEAEQLHKEVDSKILVLTPPAMSDIAPLTSEKMDCFVFAVDDIGTLKQLANSGRVCHVHLVANTGMNRHGAECQEFEEMVKFSATCDNIKVEGAFSHFLKGDARTKMRQYAAFAPCVKIVKEYYPEAICHIANSSGQDYPLDMVRMGIGLYDPAHQNVTTLTSTIAKIRLVSVGQTVGYGCRYKVKQDTRIAVVPMGYADGLMRKFSGANVLIEGQLCPIVGSVCMDCCFIDVTNCDAAKPGSRVTIWGTDGVNNIEVGTLAKKCCTINYELLTHVGSRVEREYLQ